VRLDSYDALDQRIARLRSALHLPPNFEFHWAKIGWRERDAYVGEIQAEVFRGWSLIVHKAAIPHEYEILSPNEAFCSWVAELFARLPSRVPSSAEFVIDDGTKNQTIAKAIRVAVSSSLRSRGVERRLGGARGFPPSRSAALQLADMVARATRAWQVERSRDYESCLGGKVVVSQLGN